MFRLLSNSLKLFLLVTTVITSLVLLPFHSSNHYLAAAKDKRLLLDSVKSPRIILAGGSNVAFGIDSEKIESHFGMPVINMGLHANVGLRFMLDEIRPALGEGDIVILSPEYEHFKDNLDGDRSEVLGNVIRYCPECASGLSTPKQVFNVIIGIPQLAQNDIFRALYIIRWGTSIDEKIYNRGNFNQKGDFIGHLNQPGEKFPRQRIIQVLPHNQAIELLNSFYESCESQNAQVFFMFPSTPRSGYLYQEKNFVSAYNTLSKELDIPILGTPQDFIYPDEYFYDTVYHLNADGRDKRTNRIIELLSTTIKSH